MEKNSVKEAGEIPPNEEDEVESLFPSSPPPPLPWFSSTVSSLTLILFIPVLFQSGIKIVKVYGEWIQFKTSLRDINNTFSNIMKNLSLVFLCLSLTFASSEQIAFPSSSSSSASTSTDANTDKESSTSGSSQIGDHEESEQLQAFVIADPSYSASSQSSVVSPVSSSNSVQDESSQGETETINPIAASLLLNLALNNMAATMSHGPGGQPFRSSRDCGCGCKCGHGSSGSLCPHCTQRGWGRGSPCPCANKHINPSSSYSGEYQSSGDYYAQGSNRVERMTPAPFYHYPVYYDAATGIPLPGQERNAQLYHPFGPNSLAAEKAAVIAAASHPMASYVRPSVSYRYVPKYVYSPQYYYYPGQGQSLAPSASYPIPAYAYPPSYGQQPFAAAASPIPSYSYSRVPMIMAASRRSSLPSPYFASPLMMSSSSSPFSYPLPPPSLGHYAMVMPKYYSGYYWTRFPVSS